MFADYIKLVLLDYEQKRAKNALPSTLSLPTNAKLRDACMEACSKRYTPKDVRILSDIFGAADDQKVMLKRIENYDADKLKPLWNFINGKTKRPDTRVVELLALLIDFEPRPFELGKHYALPETTAGESGEMEGGHEDGKKEGIPLEGGGLAAEQPETVAPVFVQTAPEVPEDPAGQATDPVASGEAEENQGGQKTKAVPDEPDPAGVKASATPEQPEADKALRMGAVIPEPEVRKPQSVFKRGLALLAITLLALAGFWVYRGGKKEPEPIPMGLVLPANNACMYWTGDHYEQIACSAATGDTLAEPLDLKKMGSFKKITRPDTITRQSKGAVWYVKINGGKEIEFYTSDGFHPIDRKLRLKPITDYMIAKYIHPEQQ